MEFTYLPPSSDRLLGEESEWFGYLESLPRDLVDLALFWGSDATNMRSHDLRDGKEAMLWLRGTEVEKELAKPMLVSEEYNASTFVITSLSGANH